MTNKNTDLFKKIQLAQKSEYIGGPQERGLNDSDYNDGGNTDKSPGAEGRKV